MSHYAILDENNIVTEVITGRNEDEIVDGISDWEAYYGEIRGQVCKRTSCNTYAGKHKENKTPYRKNYAGIGMIYDTEHDAFIMPKPNEGFYILNEETCQWEEVTE